MNEVWVMRLSWIQEMRLVFLFLLLLWQKQTQSSQFLSKSSLHFGEIMWNWTGLLSNKSYYLNELTAVYSIRGSKLNIMSASFITLYNLGFLFYILFGMPVAWLRDDFKKYHNKEVGSSCLSGRAYMAKYFTLSQPWPRWRKFNFLHHCKLKDGATSLLLILI